MECGIIAVEWPDRTLRVREDINLLETLPCESGGFDIVSTVLNNPSFPLLRYEIGDRTDSPIKRLSHGFAVLQNVAGRNDDVILTRTGGRVHPACVDAVFEACTSVRRYRVHQDSSGRLAVNIELQDDQSRVSLTRIRRQLKTLVEGFPVLIKVVDQIEQTAAGKHRLVTSDRAHEVQRAPSTAPRERGGRHTQIETSTRGVV